MKVRFRALFESHQVGVRCTSLPVGTAASWPGPGLWTGGRTRSPQTLQMCCSAGRVEGWSWIYRDLKRKSHDLNDQLDVFEQYSSVCVESELEETVSCTLQHTVVRLPVLSAQSLPEAWRLHPLITLMDGHLTAAVETCFQGAPESNRMENMRSHATRWWSEDKRLLLVKLTVLWSLMQPCSPRCACGAASCSRARGRWSLCWCSARSWRPWSAGCCSGTPPPAGGLLPAPRPGHSTDANHLNTDQWIWSVESLGIVTT